MFVNIQLNKPGKIFIMTFYAALEISVDPDQVVFPCVWQKFYDRDLQQFLDIVGLPSSLSLNEVPIVVAQRIQIR